MSEAVRQGWQVVRQPYKGGEGSEFISVRQLGPFPRVHARIDPQTADELRLLAKCRSRSLSDDWRSVARLVYAQMYCFAAPNKFADLVEDMGHEAAVNRAALRWVLVARDDPALQLMCMDVMWRWFTSRKMQRH